MFCPNLRCYAFADCVAHNKPESSVISSEARNFILRSTDAEWETIDLSTEGVTQLRQENSEVAAQGWRSAKDADVTIENEVINGVECQWVCPNPPRGSEVILYFFGGGFIVGSPDDDLAITARLAAGTGRRTCVPKYRLAPENPYPAASLDALAVYQALVQKSDLLVVGESAGGNLALGLLLTICNSPKQMRPPIAAALLSPWIDLTHSGVSHGLGLDPTLAVEQFLVPASLAYAGARPRESAEISPLFVENIPPNFPPVILSTGTRDLLMSDSIRLAQRLQAAGCQVEFRVAEGLWHVFEWYPQLPEARASAQDIAKFLLRHCRT